MYINFERLLSSGMTAQELLYLLAVRQKEKMIVETIPDETVKMFREKEWIEGEKTVWERYRAKCKRGGIALNLVYFGNQFPTRSD